MLARICLTSSYGRLGPHVAAGGDAHHAARRPSTPRPRKRSSAADVSMSRSLGTLRRRLSPSERSVAQRMGSAAFLAPLMGMVPERVRPPRMRIASMPALSHVGARARSEDFGGHERPRVPPRPPVLSYPRARPCAPAPSSPPPRCSCRRDRGRPRGSRGALARSPRLPRADRSRPPACGSSLPTPPPPASGTWACVTSYAFRPVALRDAETNAIALDVIEHQVTSDLVGGVGLWHRLHLGVDCRSCSTRPATSPRRGRTPAIGAYTAPARRRSAISGSTRSSPSCGPTAGRARRLRARARGAAEPAHRRHGLVHRRGRGQRTRRGCSRSTGSPALGVHGGARLHPARPPRGLRLRDRRRRRVLEPLRQRDPLRPRRELPAPGARHRPEGPDDLVPRDERPPARGPLAPFKSTAASSLTARRGGPRRRRAGRLGARRRRDLADRRGGRRAGAGMLSVSWAPRDHDRDGDGIPDDVDQCPDLPEDFDGFQDADGCPDVDNDGDGIPDKLDKCPNSQEDFDGYQDADGCPDPDHDGDGIPDDRGRLPRRPGPARPRTPRRTAAPIRDSDGDGIPDDERRLPRRARRPPDATPSSTAAPPDRTRRRRHPRPRGRLPRRVRAAERRPRGERLPRSGHRTGTPSRRRRQVPERARDVERLPGRRRLPRRGAPGQGQEDRHRQARAEGGVDRGRAGHRVQAHQRDRGAEPAHAPRGRQRAGPAPWLEGARRRAPRVEHGRRERHPGGCPSQGDRGSAAALRALGSGRRDGDVGCSEERARAPRSSVSASSS